MNQAELARDREERLLAILVDKARAGLPCPHVERMSQLLGMQGRAGSWIVLSRLARKGVVEVERVSRRVVVVIPALGLRTAHPRSATPDGRIKRPVADLVAIAAGIACLPVDDVLGRKREKLYLRPRYLAAWFCRAEGWSTLDTGRYFGRDHSTVGNALRQADWMLEKDALFSRMHRRMRAHLDGRAEPILTVPSLPVRPLAQVLVPRKRWAGDETAEPGHQLGAARLLAALRREHPERCAA